MKKSTIVALIILLAFAACRPTNPTAQQIVDLALEQSGVKELANAEATFTFRNIRYTYSKKNGVYEYTRIQTDTLGNEVKDILNNEGFERRINGEQTIVGEKKKEAYTASVNSVIYFAFLPFSLNDAAVNKTLIGIVEIDGKNYYKIKVTFDSDGGGEDYEDVFFYWFDTDDYSMDYLAYSYNEEDGMGIRLRVAYNSRKVNGVIIQDYKNLKPTEKNSVPLDVIDQGYMNGKLTELSLIELEDVVINTIK